MLSLVRTQILVPDFANHVHLTANSEFTFPLSGSRPRPLPSEPFSADELKTFYAQLARINKKVPDHVKHGSPRKLKPGWKTTYEKGKKCCGNEWIAVAAGLPVYHEITEDVKPVVEHIQDDLKYDFRTKTHSL